ncbi:MAG: DUF533 domain-containing protein [Verrucomicrobiales bacterium]|nr:DUF533 domain-containing protein [Verrucomicrobiales bacterium]
MDAIKILGTLLSNNAMGSPAGGNILGSLLGGGSSSSGAGDILGTLLGGQKRGGGGGGLGALGAILAAAAAAKGGGSGGGMDILGSLLGSGGGGSSVLGSLLGGSAPASKSGGGLSGMLGSLLGGGRKTAAPAGGGAGDLLGSLLGAATSGGGSNPLSGILGAAAQGGGTSGSDLLGMLMGGGEQAAPPKEAQEEAEILIAAMCNAAKADGTIDGAEKEAILGRLGELDEQEVAYLKEHLSGPVNLDEFTSNVPDDMDEQVYAFSLMAIKLDTQKEAEYFGKLANGLGLDGDACNQIHKQLGQPEIFA